MDSCYESTSFHDLSGPQRLAGTAPGVAASRPGGDRAWLLPTGPDGPRMDGEPAQRLPGLGAGAVAAEARAKAAPPRRARGQGSERQPVRRVPLAAGSDRPLHHRALLAPLSLVVDLSRGGARVARHPGDRPAQPDEPRRPSRAA